MNKKDLLKMKIGNKKWSRATLITRVYSGWLYMFHDDATDTITSSVFVPLEIDCNTRDVS